MYSQTSLGRSGCIFLAVFIPFRIIVDEISTLKAKARRRIDLFLDSKINRDDFNKVPNIKEIEVEDGSLHCVVTGSEHELLKRAVELGVNEVRTQESSLEEIFLGLVSAK